MQENPELPVIPFVDGEIVGDDWGRWIGSWGSVRLDEYLFPRYEDQPILFRSDDDVCETLERFLAIKELDELESEEEYRKAYDALPWEKVIVVNIDLPE